MMMLSIVMICFDSTVLADERFLVYLTQVLRYSVNQSILVEISWIFVYLTAKSDSLIFACRKAGLIEVSQNL